jgi:hypothetical protein
MNDIDQDALDFERAADERWRRLLESGRSIDWSEGRAWIEARARGEQARKPQAASPLVPDPLPGACINLREG